MWPNRVRKSLKVLIRGGLLCEDLHSLCPCKDNFLSSSPSNLKSCSCEERGSGEKQVRYLTKVYQLLNGQHAGLHKPKSWSEFYWRWFYSNQIFFIHPGCREATNESGRLKMTQEQFWIFIVPYFLDFSMQMMLTELPGFSSPQSQVLHTPLTISLGHCEKLSVLCLFHFTDFWNRGVEVALR